MALPAAGLGFDPKTGPLPLSLGGETPLNTVPQLPQQLSDAFPAPCSFLSGL